MSKIFGDEFKDEIRNLKKLDKNLTECKANIEEVIYVIQNRKGFINSKPSLTEALQAVLSLSTTVEKLLENIQDFEKTYDNASGWVRKRINNKASFIIDLNRIRKVRSGAEKLIKEYNVVLKELGAKYRQEVLKRD